MGVEKDRAIVIHSFPLREADRIVTFCTPHFGKVRAIARGSRKAKSRLSASVELFNVGELVFYHRPNRDLQYVNAFDVDLPIAGRLRDPLTVAYASHFAELVGHLSLEGEENPALFELLRAGLEALPDVRSVRDLHRLARSFEMKLLVVSGYRPHFESCVVCSGPLPRDEVAVGLHLGGALCERHCQQDRTLVVAPSTLDGVRELARRTLAEATSIDLSRREAIEMKRLLSLFLEERLERRLRCHEYIDGLERNVREETPIHH